MQIWLSLSSAVANHPRVTLNPEALCGFASHHPIQSTGGVNRRLIGDDRTRPGCDLTFLVIEARRYEHAGGANRIHRR